MTEDRRPGALGEYDPFEAFDDVIGGDVRDPYPDLAERRRQTPVWKGALLDQGMIPEGLPIPETWTAFTFEDCSRILRDPETFTSTGYDDTIGMVMGHTILGMDDPEHRTHRSLVSEAFRQRSLQRWEETAMGPICDELVDRFARRGRAELVRELTFEFPVRVISSVLGLPQEDFAQFQRWSIELIGVGANVERGLAASASLAAYFAEVVEERRRDPRDDVISDLVRSEVDGQRLSDESIYSFLRLLLPAGAETTYRSSGNLIYLLLTHPEQLDSVRRDRSLLAPAIEEGLRAEPPLLTIGRTATRDVEVAGAQVPEGASVVPCLGSANHDESRWEDPDTFDIRRPPKQHLAFAFGPHMCLGMHLARIETRVIVSSVLDRLPGVTLDPERDDPHIRGLVFRSPTSLPVLFEPARR